jgi:radical SAM protein with 4Fe4S-binding SPASM domain
MDFLPHTISWNLTRRCNLRCAHCYLEADFRAGHITDELSTRDCFDLVTQIAEVNPGALLILTGGEPLLRPDIFDVAGCAATHKLLVVVATNGTAVDPANARRMASAGIKGVGLSLHSERAEGHDRFTGVPGSWQAALGAAEVLREVGMEVVVQTSAMSWNCEEIPRVVALAHKLGARFFNLYFLVCTGRGQGLTDISSAQYERLLVQLYELQKEYAGRLLISAKCAPHYKRVVYAADPNSPFLKTYPGGCPAATHYCRISPEGEVTPCPYLPLGAGNVRRTRFAKIWREAPLLEKLRDRSRLEGRCGVCEFKSLCGGCRARAYAEAQNYLAEDPSCSYEPGRYGFKEIALAEEDRLGGGIEHELPWTGEAWARLLALPSFVRGMVVKGVEHFARERQCLVVTAEIMKQAREAIAARRGSMMPMRREKNQP